MLKKILSKQEMTLIKGGILSDDPPLASAKADCLDGSHVSCSGVGSCTATDGVGCACGEDKHNCPT